MTDAQKITLSQHIPLSHVIMGDIMMGGRHGEDVAGAAAYEPLRSRLHAAQESMR